MIRIANKHAAKSDYYFRLGCVITKGKRVLSTGHNSIRYCEANVYKNSRHAEMDAILKLIHKPNGLSSLAGATIYVSRVTRAGKPAMARPCGRCMDLILSVGIKEVIYTSSSGTIKEKL